MNLINCNCTSKCNCVLFAVIAAVIVGIVAAFLQITAVITVTPVFLWVALGIAVVYLAGLAAATILARSPRQQSICACSALNALLVGILSTIFFSAVLLAVGIVATSVFSAIVIGLLAASLTLTFVSTACYIRSLADCAN